MAQEIYLPELGENVDAAEITKVFVAVGDAIQLEQPLLEMETGKAVVELPSPASGVIEKVYVTAGAKIQPGAPLFSLKNGVDSLSAKETKVLARATAVDAARKEIEAPVDRSVASNPAAGGPVGAEAAGEKAEPLAEEAPGPKLGRKTRVTTVPAAPSVRLFAREIGVDIQDVQSSGANGRISLEDVKRHARETRGAGASVGTGSSGIGAVTREALSAVRKYTATHLSDAWRSIPHVTQFDQADVTALEGFRKQYKAVAEKAGGKLTLTAILVKIVCAALKQFPRFNASLDMVEEELILKQYIHVGVAVDTDRGLLAPVIRDVDRKSIVAIAAELQDLSIRARDRKLKPEEMAGGNFTISNLGGLGGKHFTPIVNAPEVAILGVGRAEMQPVFVDGAFQPRLLLPLALSYDHRVIDGADGTRFLRWLVGAIEYPILMQLED